MSTRALIARKEGEGWIANYHHWDGYPSGLGATLYELYHGYFNRDLAAMLKLLIDDHPAGWSTINGADFDLPIGWSEPGAECYCHGGRQEEASLVTDESRDFLGAEFVYILDPQTNDMTILGRGLQWFGLDDLSMFVTLGTVNLEDEEPDWERLDDLRRQHAGKDYN